MIISSGGDLKAEPYCQDVPITLNPDGPPKKSIKRCSKVTAQYSKILKGEIDTSPLQMLALIVLFVAFTRDLPKLTGF